MKPLPILIVAVVVAAVAVGATLLITGGGDDRASRGGAGATDAAADLNELRGPSGSPFVLRYPDAWKPVADDQLTGGAVAGVRRGDGKGIMLVRPAGRLTGDAKSLEAGLTERFEREFDDFRFVRAGELALPAGDAFTYTYVRTRSGQVQSIVVIEADDRSYQLNSVVGGNASDAAREVGVMVRSFRAEA